jgi:ABC-type cobalamin/Fe3+-siderophores transport system ATPase subunit
MKIFLSLNDNLNISSDKSGIIALLHPDSDKWNDFDLKLYAKLTIFQSGVKVWSKPLRMLVEMEPRTEDWFKKKLSNHSNSCLSLDDIGFLFITAQLSKDNYFSLGKVFGIDAATEILRSLHDLPTLRTQAKDSPDLSLTSTKEYFMGFVRKRDAYLISESNSNRLLIGAREDDVLREVRAFWSSYESLRFVENPTLIFDCSESALGKNRIAVLIGINGIGKTSVLVESAKIVTSTQDHISLNKITEGVCNLQDVGFDLVVFATSTTPPSNLPQGVKCIKIGAGGNHRLSRTEAVAKIGRNSDGLSLAFLRKILIEAIENFDIEVPVKHGGYTLLRTFGGERDRLDFCANVDTARGLRFVDSNGVERGLSSGEECLIDIALNVSAQVMPNTLLLLDELENSMHPKFISTGISILRAILISQNSFCIMASHSALVVREVEAISVHIFQRQNEDTKILRPMLQTFGESVGLINDIIFDDHTVKKSFETVISDAVDKSSDVEKFDREVRNLLGVDGLSYYRKIKEASK